MQSPYKIISPQGNRIPAPTEGLTFSFYCNSDKDRRP